MSVFQIATATTFLAGVALVTYIGSKYIKKKKKLVIPTEWEEVGTLQELCLFPIKSGHRIDLTEANCTERGLQTPDDSILQLRDRGLVVYSGNNQEFKHARTFPHMLLMYTSVQDKNHIAINAPNMETLYVKISDKSTTKPFKVKIHRGEKIYCIDCGDEAGTWFSKYILKKDDGLRLGYHDASEIRDITRTHQPEMNYYKFFTNFSTGLYSDFTSLMVINEASIDDLRNRMTDVPITPHHFRPNLIVKGPNMKAYDEDHWEWVKIGDVIMRGIKECTRCVMTTLNPDTADRFKNMEPLTTMRKYRLSKGPSADPVMGAHLEVRKTGVLKVGDKVFLPKKS